MCTNVSPVVLVDSSEWSHGNTGVRPPFMISTLGLLDDLKSGKVESGHVADKLSGCI